MNNYIHHTAEVSSDAKLGTNIIIWHQAQVRAEAIVGDNCTIGKGVYIDVRVVIGNNVKIQNYVSIYQGVTIEDGVFIGPHVCFTNDLLPRAINPDASPKAANDWTLSATHVKYGASLGANATIICGITIGRWAMIGAGCVVTKTVPDHGLVFGNPAKLRGFVDTTGKRVRKIDEEDGWTLASAPSSDEIVRIPPKTWNGVHD